MEMHQIISSSSPHCSAGHCSRSPVLPSFQIHGIAQRHRGLAMRGISPYSACMIGLFVGKHGETPRLRGAPCYRRGGGRAAGGDPEVESHLGLDGMQSSLLLLPLLGRSPSLAASTVHRSSNLAPSDRSSNPDSRQPVKDRPVSCEPVSAWPCRGKNAGLVAEHRTRILTQLSVCLCRSVRPDPGYIPCVSSKNSGLPADRRVTASKKRRLMTRSKKHTHGGDNT